MPTKVHEGHNVKRIREILGIKQDALAIELGDGCKNSYPAIKANEKFEEYLSEFRADSDALSLYYYALEDVFKSNDVQREMERKQVEREIENIQSKIKSLDDKMTEGTLPTDRYNRLVEGLESQLKDQKDRHVSLSMTGSEFAKYIEYNVSLLADIDGYYKNAPLLTKQKMIGSIFPENIEFNGTKYRTNKINEVFAKLCRLDKGF